MVLLLNQEKMCILKDLPEYIILPEWAYLLGQEWEYAAADVGQRECNIYKGQKKYPLEGDSYTRSSKEDKVEGSVG
jgi:hypothetical protein